MPVGCSDCGQPSVGTFDIVYSHKDSNGTDIQDTITKGRPLCSNCATARKLTLPSPPPPPSK
jgi:hypothetical protein